MTCSENDPAEQSPDAHCEHNNEKHNAHLFHATTITALDVRTTLLATADVETALPVADSFVRRAEDLHAALVRRVAAYNPVVAAADCVKLTTRKSALDELWRA